MIDLIVTTMDNNIMTTHVIIFIVVCLHVTSAQFNVGYNVSENKDEGYSIGNLASSGVLQNVTQTDRPHIRFSYLSETGEFNKYFDIDTTSGLLTTSSLVINREQVCEYSVDCVMNFDIAVKSSQFFSIVSVNVNILDINDNPPAFPKDVIDLDISENEAAGAEFRIDAAYDKDMWGNNSIQGYTIEQEKNIFDMIPPKVSDNYIVLKLNHTLDREVLSSYLVKVIARDGGDPMLQGVLNINVNVLDENDNSPVFISNGYNLTINENIAPGSVIATLSADDKDIGENAKISYTINERQSNIETIRRLFDLNETTGDLKVIKDLMSETREQYEFTVVASDNGVRPQTNTTVVRVTVNDVGNKAPVIKVNLISGGFVDIPENEQNGSFVAHVNIEDTDKGSNGDVTCSIANKYFRLEEFLGYKVVVNGEIDREKIPVHNVTITCHDQGSPKMTSSESFLVRVKDINDNTPKFEKDLYPKTMDENNAVNTFITKVIARDNDTDLNGQIEYILEDNKGRFIINNITGDIYANRRFDMEKEPVIVVRVLAVDHGETRRTATTTVSVTLNDLNDNAPVITPVKPVFRVMENLGRNVFVGQLDASDNDTGRNGQFQFAIAPIAKEFPFILSPAGELRTIDSLDRELQPRYELPVTVTDLGSDPLSNTHYVTIYVGDDNDNLPKVTFPNDINNTVKFLYPVEDYNVVTTISAYDVDEGENRSLVYSIKGGNDLGIFEIDSELGEISIKKFVDIKQDMLVTLLIEVRDKGARPKFTQASLNIELMYANASINKVTEEGSNKYVIISVVVVITTVVFAVAIVGIILFLRSLDRSKQDGESGSEMFTESGGSSNSDSQSLPKEGEDDGKLKKKKEVSFSLEFSLDAIDGGLRKESSTDDDSQQNRYYDAPPTHGTQVQHYGPTFDLQKQERIDSHMKAIKLQQYLLEAKARDWDNTEIQVQQSPLGDSESETSRETITCDSGRGGSEDEVSTSSPTTDEKRTFNYPESRTSAKHVSFSPTHYNAHNSHHMPTFGRQSTPVQHGTAPPRPPSYRGHPNNIPNSNNSKLALKNMPCAYSNNSNQNQNQNKNINQRLPAQNQNYNADPWANYYQQKQRMRVESCSSIRSNEDDGGSTTTSGSYTLDPEEIDLNMYTAQRDIVV